MPIAFVAGATGYTGRALMPLLSDGKSSWTARPHARRGGLDGAVICDPRDVPALTAGMRGCDAVVQLIGTVKARFAEGDYETIDYGTTVALGEAARAAGVPRMVLLSSVGAGRGIGHYLRVKQQTERWVQASSLEYTILRPSSIVGPGRRAIQVVSSLAWLSPTFRAIDVNDLARVIVHALERREAVRNRILEGASLWEQLK